MAQRGEACPQSVHSSQRTDQGSELISLMGRARAGSSRVQGTAGAQAWMGVWEGQSLCWLWVYPAGLGCGVCAEAGVPLPTVPTSPRDACSVDCCRPSSTGFFHSSEPVVVRVMGTVTDVLHRLGAHSTKAQSLGIAINAHSFSNDVSVPREGRVPPSHALPVPPPLPSSKAGRTPGHGPAGAGRWRSRTAPWVCTGAGGPAGRPPGGARPSPWG